MSGTEYRRHGRAIDEWSPPPRNTTTGHRVARGPTRATCPVCSHTFAFGGVPERRPRRTRDMGLWAAIAEYPMRWLARSVGRRGRGADDEEPVDGNA
jgi:ribosomal protein L34E